MVRIAVVDEDDNVVGYRDRSQKLSTEGLYRVAALWLTNSKGEILLARRSHAKEIEAGLWGPAAAGTVEEGETYMTNIIREAKEELGLENIQVNTSVKLRCPRNTNPYYMHLFTANVDKDASWFKLQPEEVAEVKWFSKEELIFAAQRNPELFVSAIPCCVEQLLLMQNN